jgi:hypothetical protein
MIPLLLSLLALSSHESPAHAPSTPDACAYEFDITRAQEPAAPGCPVASWGGDRYDAADIQPSLAAHDGALQAFRSVPVPGDGPAWI